LPTFEVFAQEPIGQSHPPAYEERLDAFLRERCSRAGKPDVVTTFHAVRKLAYFSSADRTPQAVLASGRGACTAKHLLLRDLLRRQGEVADVELIEGDFAASMPVVDTMPEALRRWVVSGGIPDFHCYVVWQGPDSEHRLDATWPDHLAPFGFPVNADWDGGGDTQLAIKPALVKVRVEDVVARKERLLAALSRDDLANRRTFLDLLSAWLAEID
jgi:hypothetical protein